MEQLKCITLHPILQKGKLCGADFEPAIVLGWYEVTGTELDLSKTGISAKDYENVQNTPMLKDSGLNIARQLIKQNPDIANQDFAYHYGRGNPKVTEYGQSMVQGNTLQVEPPKPICILENIIFL